MILPSLLLLGTVIGVTFLGGLLTRNYSQVDRLWSIFPGVLVLLWGRDVAGDPWRYILSSTVVLLWCVRLSLNFARRGGYRFSLRKKGFYEEDYRWPILKEKIPNRFLFELFNFSFISTFQLTLIFLFTLPLYFVAQAGTPLTLSYVILVVFHLLFLSLETVADNQQWRYYQRRNSEEYAGDPRYALGFNTTGLWRFSRHPNYLMEMSQWVVVWLYAVVTTGTLHWSGIGVAVLILLFMGSTAMAEKITLSKYSAYKEWKKITPPWIPFIDFPLRSQQRARFWNDLRKDTLRG